MEKLLAYIFIVIILFFIHKGILNLWDNIYFGLLLGVVFTLAFLAFVVRVEKKEFQQMPIIGKYIR